MQEHGIFSYVPLDSDVAFKYNIAKIELIVNIALLKNSIDFANLHSSLRTAAKQSYKVFLLETDRLLRRCVLNCINILL